MAVAIIKLDTESPAPCVRRGPRLSEDQEEYMQAHFQDDSITIHKIQCGPYGNNAYLLVCPETNESIVIDAPPDPAALIEAAQQTDVKAILITHNHFDHIEGLDQVREALGAPVGIGSADADGLPNAPEIVVDDGDEINAGKITLTAIFTPGHTAGSTCFSFGSHLFTGDTLFPNGPGRSRDPEALGQLITSITERLFTLDGIADFYPGHGDDGNLATEKGKYEVFASREHPADLQGDVDWLKS